MRITTATNLIAEPIFPSYTFTGSIEMPDGVIASLLSEVNKMNLHQYNWGRSGWNFDFNQTWYLTEGITKFASLITRQFFEGYTSQFGHQTMADVYIHGNKKFTFECRRVFPVVLFPGHDFPVQSRISFYTGITMLQCSTNSHRPYIQNLDNRWREHDPIRCWIPEKKQQIYIPDDQPWGISSGNDDTMSVALITHILRKPV